MWQLNRIYARLQSMANNARQNASSSRCGPTRTRGGKNCYPRYRGLPENANNRLLPTNAKTPFVSLVSKSWARKSGNLDLQMVVDPEDFTILSLLMPDLDLNPQDLEYLGVMMRTRMMIVNWTMLIPNS